MSPPEILLFPLQAFNKNNYAREIYYHGRYKLQDFVLLHFVFAVNYVHDKNVLYGIYIYLVYGMHSIL